MKKIFLALTVFVLLSGCDHDSSQDLKKGFVQLSFSMNEGGRTKDAPEPAFVLLSIVDSKANLIEENKKLPLYRFGSGYVSESLQLVKGHYKLTKFMVLDAANNVIYATPVEGSPNAGLVNDPLPIDFIITENGSTLVTPQVLEVTEENTPENFGYVNFGFDVVVVPADIKVSFLMPTLPYFTTDGYDSVVVILSSAETNIVKQLNIISPIEAVGNFTRSEISSNGVCGNCWEITVKAYYEVIDEVPYNFHVNESVTTLNLSIDNNVNKIEIRESTLSLIKNDTRDTHAISWNHRAHMTDAAGYFHFVLNNDFCNPDFSYDILKSNVVYLYYEKAWINNSQEFNQLHIEYTGTPEFIAKGSYSDNNIFDGIDCESVNPGALRDNTTPFFYFYVYDNEFADCYIVWESLKDPHDPLKNGRSTENNTSEGYFRMSSSGIEKHRAEAFARMMK